VPSLSQRLAHLIAILHDGKLSQPIPNFIPEYDFRLQNILLMTGSPEAATVALVKRKVYQYFIIIYH
jgi:hypothetical protein